MSKGRPERGVSRSERARRPECRAEAARAWAGRPERWDGCKAQTPVDNKGLVPFYKKVGLFRKGVREWGRYRVLRARERGWGGAGAVSQASLVQGGKGARPAPAWAWPTGQEELAVWRAQRPPGSCPQHMFGRTLALSLKDTSVRNSERPQRRDGGRQARWQLQWDTLLELIETAADFTDK